MNHHFRVRIPRRRGLTLVEMLIAVFVIGAGLFLLVGWSRMVREEAKRRLAAATLRQLDRALAEYLRDAGAYPPAPADDATVALAALIENRASRATLAGLPENAWSSDRPRRLLDAWGTPLRLLADPRRSPAVAANKGRPIFVSAGPDRDFGDRDRACLGDNLRSDDPDAAGFAE